MPSGCWIINSSSCIIATWRRRRNTRRWCLSVTTPSSNATFVIDNFGGQFSALGHGKIDNEKRAIEFTFDYKDGPFTNKFSFDPASKTWTSLMRQRDKGEWRLFAEDKFTRIEAKK